MTSKMKCSDSKKALKAERFLRNKRAKCYGNIAKQEGGLSPDQLFSEEPTAQLMFLNQGVQSTRPLDLVNMVRGLVPGARLRGASSDAAGCDWRQAVQVKRAANHLLMLFETEHDAATVKRAVDELDRWNGRPVWAAFYTRDHLLDPWNDAIIISTDDGGDSQSPPSSSSPLTPNPVTGVPGLYIVSEFVSVDEEQAMLRDMDSRPWASLSRRTVQHYGFEFDYATNAVAVDRPLPGPWPGFVQLTVDRMRARLPGRLVPVDPDQCTVNRYEPGAGIPPHTDTHSPFGPAIYSLTLGAGTCIEFQGPPRSGVPTVEVYLAPRSLMVMAGDARYGWSHGIACRSSDLLGGQLVARATRTSLTLRAVVRGDRPPCQCPFPDRCDSFAGGARADMGPVEAANVRRVYNAIAPHFSETRHSQWPRVRQWLDSRPPGAWIADVGCGNGKYLTGCGPARSLLFGSDASSGLLVDVCARARRLPRLVLASCLSLPYRDAAFDAVACIAVVHHMSSPDRRLAALTELARIVRPGGRILVTVWTKEQKKFRASDAQDLFVDWRSAPSPGAASEHWKTLPKQAPASACPMPGLKTPDISVEKRYYHVFLLGELTGLAKQLSHIVTVVDHYESNDNYCLDLEKI